MQPIYLKDYMHKPLRELVKAIENNPKQELESLRFYDLLIDENTGNELRHGVYMFFESANTSKFSVEATPQNGEFSKANKLGCLYVGKCDTSHFASRIGLHFGLTPLSRFNTFLRRSVDALIKHKQDDKDFKLNHRHFYDGVVSLKQHKLLLLPTLGLSPKLARPIEKLMMELLKPTHNRLSKTVEKANLTNKLDQTLAEVLIARKVLSQADSDLISGKA